MGKAYSHLLRATPGPSGSLHAHHPLTYPTQAPPHTGSLPQSFELELQTNWFKKERLRSCSLILMFSLLQLPTFLRLQISILPVALQRYFILQSWLIGSWKDSRALLSEVGKGCHKAEGACSPIKQGIYSKWGQWFEVVLKQNPSVELKEHLIAVSLRMLEKTSMMMKKEDQQNRFHIFQEISSPTTTKSPLCIILNSLKAYSNS